VFAYAPNGVLLWIVPLESRVEGVAAIWGNVLFVPSDKGVVLVDCRYGIVPSARIIFVWSILGGVVSSPVVVAHDTSAERDQDHGPVVYVTCRDQFVYKLRIEGWCNSKVSEPCAGMSAVIQWSRPLQYTPESAPYYTFQDERCSAPFNLARTANLQVDIRIFLCIWLFFVGLF